MRIQSAPLNGYQDNREGAPRQSGTCSALSGKTLKLTHCSTMASSSAMWGGWLLLTGFEAKAWA